MRRLISTYGGWVAAAVVLIAVLATPAFGSMKRYLNTSPSDNRKTAVQSRNDAFNQAKALYPDPKNVNFPMRKQLVEFDQREDQINHPWYVYIQGINGNTIGYYVAKFVPESVCNFLSSTEDVWSGDNVALKMQSPSYDGVYYGNCDSTSWFIFDYATNAMVMSDQKYTIADQPLDINADPIKVVRDAKK